MQPIYEIESETVSVMKTMDLVNSIPNVNGTLWEAVLDSPQTLAGDSGKASPSNH